MENENFIHLQNVIRECIEYVGSANYDSRERHAKRVAAKALVDYNRGEIPKWFDDKED